MQLLLNQTSPYARVARLTALEAGFGDRLELVWSDPWNEDAQLLAANPVNKVPVLITDEGIALSETLLICVYLHQWQAAVRLRPNACNWLVWDRA